MGVNFSLRSMLGKLPCSNKVAASSKAVKVRTCLHPQASAFSYISLRHRSQMGDRAVAVDSDDTVDGVPLGDFAGIVRQQQAMVFSIALHFLRDRRTAEEIAQ